MKIQHYLYIVGVGSNVSFSPSESSTQSSVSPRRDEASTCTTGTNGMFDLICDIVYVYVLCNAPFNQN